MNAAFIESRHKAWDRFLDQLARPGIEWVRNARVAVQVLDIDGLRVPVTVDLAGNSQTSWVASLLNAYGRYARDEVRLVGLPWSIRPLAYAASHVAEQLLRAGGITRAAYVNNWLVSTNLHPKELTANRVLEASRLLVQEHPNAAIVMRSLVPALHETLMKELVHAGFLLLPSRQVFLYENLSTGAWRRKPDVKRDLKLEASQAPAVPWVPGSQFSEKDFIQATALYQTLYRKKYPKHNPDYSVEFLRIGHQTGWLTLAGLRDPDTGWLCGVTGSITQDNVMAAPILGYDMTAPMGRGLYRRLILFENLQAEGLGVALHGSSGAGKFKEHRGATCHVEFAAVDVRHLPLWRQGALRTLHRTLMRHAVPYLQSRAF